MIFSSLFGAVDGHILSAQVAENDQSALRTTFQLQIVKFQLFNIDFTNSVSKLYVDGNVIVLFISFSNTRWLSQGRRQELLEGVFLLYFHPLPFLSFSFPPTSSPFPTPFLRLPFPLEVGPLKPTSGSGGAL